MKILAIDNAVDVQNEIVLRILPMRRPGYIDQQIFG